MKLLFMALHDIKIDLFFTVSFTSEEKFQLKNLPNREYILVKKLISVFLFLTFAYFC